jgi:iron(III) transport system substrate-binding protein
MKIPTWIIMLFAAAGLLLNGCAPETTIKSTPIPYPVTDMPTTPQSPNSPTETPSALDTYMIPVYYPGAYISTVNGSKLERNLTIYSDLSAANWDAFIKTFNSHYPWVIVRTVNLKTADPFAQYDREVAEGQPTADMIVSSDPVGWLKFFENRSVMIYSSQEDLYIPDMAKSVYGTYALSSEPMVIIYNKKLVSAPPKNMTELAGYVKNDPDQYKGKIATTDADLNQTSFAINWFWTNSKDQTGWDILATIGESQPMLMESDGKVLEAVVNGEAKIGYFVSSDAVLPYIKTHPDIGWVYMNDNQPVVLHSVAITEKAANPNSAKLMMDFILSQEGQYTLSLGGLTSYRNDISGVTTYHLDNIYTNLGENNVPLYSFDTHLNNQTLINDFLEKWRAAVHKEVEIEPTPTPTK